MEKKKRTGSGRVLGTVIVVAFMLLYWVTMYAEIRIVFTLFTAVVASLATYEMIHAVGNNNKVLYAVSMAYSAVEVFLISYKINVKWNIILTAYIILVLILTVAMHEKTKFTDAACAILVSVAFSYSFSCFILIRDYYLINPTYTKQDCFWLFIIGFGASWLTDSCAFLIGRKFGKHKLCPKISPKKSVEGAVFGTVASAALAVIVYTVFDRVMLKIYGHVTLGEGGRKLIVLFVLMLLLSIVSIFGDLSASILKRNYGLKDYSQLIPGHGGIMDRFDSSVFVLPALYAIVSSVDLFYS